MVKQDWMVIVAGEALVDALTAETARRCGRKGDRYDSEQLVKLQQEQARRGVVGATIVESIYGFSVRYDSGLQNFGLIASARGGQLDGSLDAAVAFARDWAAQDPSRRYVWMRKADQK